jgi:hypothetical protein
MDLQAALVRMVVLVCLASFLIPRQASQLSMEAVEAQAVAAEAAADPAVADRPVVAVVEEVQALAAKSQAVAVVQVQAAGAVDPAGLAEQVVQAAVAVVVSNSSSLERSSIKGRSRPVVATAQPPKQASLESQGSQEARAARRGARAKSILEVQAVVVAMVVGAVMAEMAALVAWVVAEVAEPSSSPPPHSQMSWGQQSMSVAGLAPSRRPQAASLLLMPPLALSRLACQLPQISPVISQ